MGGLDEARMRNELPVWPGAVDLGAEMPDCDAATAVGHLSNDFRYYVRENAEPRDRVELSVIVRAGSIDELADERGVAHIIEHLAFRGRKDEAGSWGTLRELEAAGVKFGSHQNAYTSQEETVYFLHVPCDFVPRALKLLAALVCDVRLGDDDLDKERAIVIEEWRQRKSWASRASEAHLRQTFFKSNIPDRMPIGTLDVIANVKAATLRRFYERQYKPRAMAVIVVGDLQAIPGVDAQGDVVKMLEEAFGSYFQAGLEPEEWPRPPEKYFGPESVGHALGARFFYEASPAAPMQVRASVFEDDEASATSCFVTCARPFGLMRTVGDFRDWIADDLFHLLLNRRLHRKSIEPKPPFCSAASQSERPIALCRGMRAVTFSAISVTPKTRDQAAEALEAAWREVELVRRFGFTPDEVRVGRAAFLAELYTHWLERDQAESAGLADECREHFLLLQPFFDAQTEVSLTLRIADDLTAAQLAQRADVLYPPLTSMNAGDRIICATRPTRPGLFMSLFDAFRSKPDAAAFEDDLRGALRRAAATDGLPALKQGAVFDEAKFFLPTAAPGNIVERTQHQLVDGQTAVEVAFANGLRCVFLRTDFRDDEVIAYGVAAAGLSEMLAPRSKGGAGALNAARLASSLAREYGYYGEEREAVMDALGGKRCALSADIDAYRRTVDGDCASNDLGALMALVHRLFACKPKRQPDRLNTFCELLREGVAEQWRDPKSRYAKLVDEINTQNHKYFAPVTLSDVDDFDASLAADYFDAAFRSPDGFAIVFAGHLPPDAELEQMAEAYLGSIPKAAPLKASSVDGVDFGFFDGAAPRHARAVAPLGVAFPPRAVNRALRYPPAARVAGDDSAGLCECATRISFPVAVGGGDLRDGGNSGTQTLHDAEHARAVVRLREHMMLDVASSVFSARLTEAIRFNDSAAYSVAAYLSFATATPLTDSKQPLEGVLTVYASHDPATADTFRATCLAELEKIGDEGPAVRELESTLKAAANDRAEALRRNAFWAPSLALTYVNARFNGSLGTTFRESCRIREEVHAALSDPAGVGLLRDAFKRSLRPSDRGRRRTIVTLSPRSRLFVPALALAAAAAAIAAVAIARRR
ncbi:hypothetical protein M885DRAFT_521277 [Pelagophyceae sp. CCMP2097]|nr:hypothetical protein M885DRAFT_521277 [Pelagophyceae sp. CCMP2097]